MPDTTHRRLPTKPVDVLLVEDNPGDVRLVREAFDATDGATALHVVTNGDEAVDFLTQQGDYEDASLPDLVLLDLALPRRGGVEVLEALGDEPRLQRLPVIMLTDSAASADVAACYETNANAYLTKPTDHDELVATIETIERFWFEAVQLPPNSQ
ncbi:response regulator [Natrinema salaciae]|uniref:Response regulator receiver domain-containing protein n=1 Tax=Natrinema salaciae TaxID=1186196 RepID=A0A1H9G5T6_9EURY|nr:response regulator [Natrinema salaciae]SEQ45370.1 Response regulator receiver domain-containing protein [Natrinema salaciae]